MEEVEETTIKKKKTKGKEKGKRKGKGDSAHGTKKEWEKLYKTSKKS